MLKSSVQFWLCAGTCMWRFRPPWVRGYVPGLSRSSDHCLGALSRQHWRKKRRSNTNEGMEANV